MFDTRIICPYCSEYCSEAQLDSIWAKLKEVDDKTKIKCEKCNNFYRIYLYEVQIYKCVYMERIEDVDGQMFFDFYDENDKEILSDTGWAKIAESSRIGWTKDNLY